MYKYGKLLGKNKLYTECVLEFDKKNISTTSQQQETFFCRLACCF